MKAICELAYGVVLALTLKIALPGVVVLLSAAALLLGGCGGSSGSKSQRTTNASERQKAAEGSAHGIQMYPPPPAPPGDEQASVVRVGSEPITRASYVHSAQTLTPTIASYEPRSRTECSSVRAPIELKVSKQRIKELSPAELRTLCVRQKQAEVRESALVQLISSRWLIGEAAERGVGVSEAQAQQLVAKDVAQQFKSKAEFQHFLQGEYRTLADITSEIRTQTAAEHLQGLIERKAGKKIDEASIARYYRTHKASFEVPEARDVRVVRTLTRAAIESAMAEVRHGKSIAEVAKRVSIDKPSNEHGGLIEGVVKGQEEAGLDQAIFSAKLHELVGPLPLRKRYYAFEVVRITPASIKPYKQIEAKVREALSKQLLETEKASFVAAFRKKWLARTSCSPGYVISRCKEWRGARPFAREGLVLR